MKLKGEMVIELTDTNTGALSNKFCAYWDAPSP